MEPLTNLVKEYVTLGRDRFARTHTRPCLLLSGEREPMGDGLDTDTHSLSPREVTRPKPDAAALERLGSTYILWLVKGPWGRSDEPITIGRSGDVDLVIRHPTISRIQARFEVTPDGAVTLVDAGSRNGTRVNGKRVKPDHPVELQAGDTITFAKIETTFQSPDGLCAILEGALTSV